MMFEILSQAQQTIAAVPLDPKEMTALIQQINNMYQSTFNLYLVLFGIGAALLGVLVAIILAVQNWFSKKDISDTVKELATLKKSINEISETTQKFITLQSDFEKLNNDLNAFKTNSIELRIIDAKKERYHTNTSLLDQAKEQEALGRPEDAIGLCIIAIHANLEQISEPRLNSFEQLSEWNNSTNNLLILQISFILYATFKYARKVILKPGKEIETSFLNDWREALSNCFKCIRNVINDNEKTERAIIQIENLLESHPKDQHTQTIENEHQNPPQQIKPHTITNNRKNRDRNRKGHKSR